MAYVVNYTIIYIKVQLAVLLEKRTNWYDFSLEKRTIYQENRCIIGQTVAYYI